jgi:hypothetical protein
VRRKKRVKKTIDTLWKKEAGKTMLTYEMIQKAVDQCMKAQKGTIYIHMGRNRYAKITKLDL